MDAIRRIILMLVGLGVSVLVTVLVMIHGWGLEPKSWWWIIGFYLVGNISAHVFVEIAKKD